jgi:hypothetical protein
MQINSDTTLRQKIEKINLLLTNNSSLSTKTDNSNTVTINNVLALNSSNENSQNVQSSAFYIGDSNLQQHDSTTSVDQISSTPTLSTQNSVEANFYKIDMLLIDLRKYIANSAVNWNTRISEFFKKSSKFDDVIKFT